MINQKQENRLHIKGVAIQGVDHGHVQEINFHITEIIEEIHPDHDIAIALTLDLARRHEGM